VKGTRFDGTSESQSQLSSLPSTPHEPGLVGSDKDGRVNEKPSPNNDTRTAKLIEMDWSLMSIDRRGRNSLNVMSNSTEQDQRGLKDVEGLDPLLRAGTAVINFDRDPDPEPLEDDADPDGHIHYSCFSYPPPRDISSLRPEHNQVRCNDVDELDPLARGGIPGINIELYPPSRQMEDKDKDKADADTDIGTDIHVWQRPRSKSVPAQRDVVSGRSRTDTPVEEPFQPEPRGIPLRNDVEDPKIKRTEVDWRDKLADKEPREMGLPVRKGRRGWRVVPVYVVVRRDEVVLFHEGGVALDKGS
jgi:hypothetical protein